MIRWQTMLKGAALALLVAAMPLAARTVPAYAGEQPNLLVVGEDADNDTVPRNSRIFNRVLRTITEEMEQQGFRVYDETAVAMDITNPNRVRRTDAELISVAQRVQQPPIDAIVVFQIYASTQRNNFSDIIDLNVRIPGRMLMVQTGRTLGNFEVAYGPRDLPPLPLNCNRDCILEHVGGQAKIIARDVGAVLAEKLSNLSPARPQANDGGVVNDADAGGGAPVTGGARAPDCTGMTTGYALIFRGFDPPEITELEGYLVAYKGYDHHRPVRTQTRYAEYWYETCSDAARLDRNLRLTMEQLGVSARISMRGSRIEVDKVGVPLVR